MVRTMAKRYREPTWKEVVRQLHKEIWKKQKNLRKVILNSSQKKVGRATTTRIGVGGNHSKHPH